DRFVVFATGGECHTELRLHVDEVDVARVEEGAANLVGGPQRRDRTLDVTRRVERVTESRLGGGDVRVPGGVQLAFDRHELAGMVYGLSDVSEASVYAGELVVGLSQLRARALTERLGADSEVV